MKGVQSNVQSGVKRFNYYPLVINDKAETKRGTKIPLISRR